QAFTCAPIDLAALRATLESSNDNVRIPRTDKGRVALSGSDGRTLDLHGDGLTLPAGTYLLSSLSLAGHAEIRLAGPVRIVVTGSIRIERHSRIDGTGNGIARRT